MKNRKLLKIENLTISGLAAKADIVRDVSFTVESRKTTVLIGPSGTGKTMIAKAILNIINSPSIVITAGKILYKNEDILTLSKKQTHRLRGSAIAMVCQNASASFDPVFTIGQQITEIIMKDKTFRKAQARRSALDMLSRVGFIEPEYIYARYPHELSAGMLQLAAVGAALISEPALLIFDEGACSLDVFFRQHIFNLLAHYQQKNGMGMLFITHNPADIVHFADEVAVLYHGQLVSFCSRQQFLQESVHPFCKELINVIDHNQYKAAITAGQLRERRI